MADGNTDTTHWQLTYQQAIDEYKPLCLNAAKELRGLRARLELADARDGETLLRTILSMEHRPLFHLDADWRADGREEKTVLTVRLPLMTAGGAYDGLWRIERKGAYAYGMLSVTVARIPVPYDGVARSAQWHTEDGRPMLDLTPTHVGTLFQWAGRWLMRPTASRVQGTPYGMTLDARTAATECGKESIDG